ncbi:hypothetical protein BO78DRAFT_313232 [Aspergillus sclerotiicarbonarius CBS 121057]|uniref:Uncharacterized protein n=1 Tax=Aspergillus sclerotiicarbonarius (strain CBS 121057 / IBT 28362) TaxID=1448318 RepID=A0A319EB58_ASPSB|nr:hypothetical protein BO78DRAFT_313232 [Aspergillus sclerotiicarbonarius CBS 121057]
MQQFQFTEAEISLANERHLKYQGTARVDLSDISFHPTISTKVDDAKLERLRRIFRTEGCRRLDIDNNVTAVVTGEHLQTALERAGVAMQTLLTNPPDRLPQLQFAPGQLQCLHGQHRLRVGKELLPQTDRCEHNARFRKRWWSRLSENKEKRLKALWRHEEFRDAFDRLLIVPGLWGGLRIGSLGKLMALKCDEEILNYLEYIREFWCSLVDENLAALAKIDQRTVDRLQLKAPGVSIEDRLEVQGLISSGRIFSQFSATERDSIWTKLASFGRIVPSLYTFFEDLKYLTACSQCVQWLLVTKKNHQTFRTTMQHMFRNPDEEAPSHGTGENGNTTDCMIQISDTTFRRTRCDYRQRLDLSYRQVWLYAMRHYPQMPKRSQNSDILAKAASEKADEAVVHELAALARKFGFESPQIAELTNLSPDRQIAQAALVKARKKDRYHYDPMEFETLIDRITSCFASAVPCTEEVVDELIADASVTSNARCGLPRTRVHCQDRRYLFVDHLHADTGWSGDQISTLFVRRCVYFAFFGPCSTTSSAELGEDSPAFQGPESPLFVPIDTPANGDGPDSQFAELERLRREITENEQEIQRLRNEALERTTEQDRLVRETQQLSNDHLRLQRQQEDTAERLRRETERAAEQDRKYHESQLAMKNQAVEMGQLRSQLEEQNAAFTRLEAQKAALLAQHDHEQESQAAVHADVEHLREELEKRSAELERLKRHEEGKAAEQAAALERFQKEAHARTTTRIQALEKEVAELTAQLNQIRLEDERNRAEPAQKVLQEHTVEHLQEVTEDQSKAIDRIGDIIQREDDEEEQTLRIRLVLYEKGCWRTTDTVNVELSNTGSWDRLLYKYKQKYFRSQRFPGRILTFYDCHLKAVSTKRCLKAASEKDAKNTLLMSFEDLPKTKEFRESVAKVLNGSGDQLITVGLEPRGPQSRDHSSDTTAERAKKQPKQGNGDEQVLRYAVAEHVGEMGDKDSVLMHEDDMDTSA